MITKLDKEFNVEWVKGFNICTEVKGVSELSDHGYLIVLSKKILRIDSSGNEIWTYAPADESLEFTCKSVVETQDNGIIVTGASWRNWRDNNISVEYVITKLSSSGNEVWQKYGGTTLKNIPFDIVQITNGNFLIFGKAESSGKTFDQLQDIIESFWLLETDNQGNFISQNIYPNNSNGEDLPVKIYKTPEENYFLTGTAVVDMYYVTNVPRILKVNDQGAEIWENTYNIKSAGGEFPHLVDMVLKDDSFIMLTYDDRGACLSEINFNGEMIWYIKLDGYPMGLMIGTQENGNYYILTRDGHIVVFNYDGYVVKYY